MVSRDLIAQESGRNGQNGIVNSMWVTPGVNRMRCLWIVGIVVSNFLRSLLLSIDLIINNAIAASEQ